MVRNQYGWATAWERTGGYSCHAIHDATHKIIQVFQEWVQGGGWDRHDLMRSPSSSRICEMRRMLRHHPEGCSLHTSSLWESKGREFNEKGLREMELVELPTNCLALVQEEALVRRYRMSPHLGKGNLSRNLQKSTHTIRERAN